MSTGLPKIDDSDVAPMPEVEKKPLTGENCLLSVFQRQITAKAFELQFGELTVKYKLRRGEVKEANIVQTTEKLQPF